MEKRDPQTTTMQTIIASAVECVCSDGNSDPQAVARDVLAALDRAGYVVGIKIGPGELAPWQKADAAVDRHHAMHGRFGYEDHPDFGKALKHAR